jgi:hypothetical protein
MGGPISTFVESIMSGSTDYHDCGKFFYFICSEQNHGLVEINMITEGQHFRNLGSLWGQKMFLYCCCCAMIISPWCHFL